MYLSEVLIVRYRGFFGRTPARIEEAPVFDIDPAEFRHCLGEEFDGVDLADLPRELHLQSSLEPHGYEWIEFGTQSDRVSFEVWRVPGKQIQRQAPGYDSVLYRLVLAIHRCMDSDFYVYHEVGDYPLVPVSMLYGLTLKHPKIADWLDQMGQHRDRLERPLLAVLHWTVEDPMRAAGLDFPDNWMPVFAMQLLAYWRVSAAHRPLVDLLRSSLDVLDRILGDILTEGYDRLLSATASAPFGELRAIAEDPENDEFARATALGAIGNLAMDGSWTESEFVEWMGQLGSKLLLERPLSFVHSAFVCEVADSNIQALHVEAKALFDQDLVDPLMITRKDFDFRVGLRGLRERGSATLARPSDGLREFLESAFAPEESGPEAPTTIRNSPKVGRNDPCPCGSGLKYKKCCGRV